MDRLGQSGRCPKGSQENPKIPRKMSTLDTTVASTGLEYWVVPTLPVPSCPWLFDPQHLTPPPVIITHEWEVPKVIAVATTPDNKAGCSSDSSEQG